MDFKFDRTAFSMQSHIEEDLQKTFSHLSYLERLEIAFYLNSVAYNFDRQNPPKMDKTAFSMRKHEPERFL